MTDSTSSGDVTAVMQALLDFWFDVDPADESALNEQFRRWFMSTPSEDHLLAQRFGKLALAAAAGELDACAGSAQGRLALIILLDQFPRSLYRGQPTAFAQDEKALALTLGGMELGLHENLSALGRVFFCMPLQHSESAAAQELSVKTFSELARLPAPKPLAARLANVADYAVEHRSIVERFGRFPHRNKALGRTSTGEELEFLESGGPSFGQ